MRRIVTIVALVAAIAGARAASAQERFWGFKGGVNGGSIVVSGAERFDTRPDLGGAAGVFAGFSIGPTLRLQPEVAFSARHFTSSDFPLNLRVDARAVEIPVLLVRRFNVDRRAQPVLLGGPQINIITKTTQTFGSTKSDITNDFRTADVGVTFGGGAEIVAGRGALSIEGRVNFGLRDLSISETTSTRSRNIVALIGYRF